MKTPIWGLVIAITLLTGCVSNFVRNNDDRYMQPGALDPNLSGYYDVYNVSLLNKYRIRYEWPLPARACKYGSMSTLGKEQDRYTGEIFWVNPIFEEAGKTLQESFMGEPRSFDSFVRSIKVQRPEYETVNGVRGISHYYENEEGLQPICFEAWVGSSHSLVMRLHKRDIATWKSQWSTYNPTGVWTEKVIGANHWHALENAEVNLASSGTGGWYLSYLTPVGDTGYTLALQLGATQQSLKSPQAHAAFQAMFKRLIESVKIEPLTPAIEADMAQLKAKAFEIGRQNCLRMKNPPGYCKRYLAP